MEADSVEIRNCLVTESLHGIYVKAGNHTVIAGNRIEGRLDLIESDRGNGIHLWNTRKNSILRNEILNVRDQMVDPKASLERVIALVKAEKQSYPKPHIAVILNGTIVMRLPETAKGWSDATDIVKAITKAETL